MRKLRLSLIFAFPLLILATLILAMSQPTQAAPAGQTVLLPGDTVIPMGPDQPDVRDAYRAAVGRFYGGGRVHWAAAPFDAFAPGAFIAPEAELTGDYASFVFSDAPSVERAYALQPGRVALLRSTVRGAGGQAAAWELAYIRDALDVYLFGALPYDVLEESELNAQALSGYELLIVPSVHLEMVDQIIAALDEAGALDAIAGFVRSGGTLYTQGNGAVVAEAAGLVPAGTVDVDQPIELPTDTPNRGVLEITDPDSPLTYSWLTDTLYILTDPTLHPAPEHEVIATLSNAEPVDTPALVRAEVDAGQVIIQVGHPTDQSRRQQIPLFMDVVLAALSSKGELVGQARQTFNPDFPPDVFPAYEAGIPVSATLQFANLWDVPLEDVVVTATVANGFNVVSDTVFPAPSAIHVFTTPVPQTQIVWHLGQVAPGAVSLGYVAETEEDVLAAGQVTFDHSQASYQEPAGKRVALQHSDTLRALMAARLVGDRDVEPDRAYRIPAEGIYLDVALPLENKENTLASNMVLTDVVYLIYPIVDLEDQHTILATNDGETIWMRNEPFFWGDPRYPLPRGVDTPTATLTLDDWAGEWCTFTSTHGIHADPPPSGSLQLRDDGSFITIPPTYTDYISVTAGNELLLPCLTMEWDMGDFPGYWYEEPAARYGVHSQELFNRMVTFVGDPDPQGMVVDATGGSVYVTAGGDPVLYREFLSVATPYAAAAPTAARLTWTDVWSRTGELPLRASFYDVFDWASCPTCEPSYQAERHAAVNLTFGMTADLDGDGQPETPVRELPTRLPETDLTMMVKSYNLGTLILSDQNLIDLPMFNGLGVKILPRHDAWWDSWSSPLGHSELVSVTHTPGYDHLYFQQDVPGGVAEVFYVSSTLQTYAGLNREGTFKLHDGARFHYRQTMAGPNRYETYDSHVHGVLGLSSDAQVAKAVGPARVSVYGDDLYYLFTMDDPHDPRTFNEDPYLQSWGYGDMVATTYVGGRDDKTLFHSILSVGDRTWLRVQIDNNHGETLTGVQVVPQPPAGITATPLFTDPGTAPDPIWPELAFLNLSEIPDAWRGVYYFELHVSEAYSGPLGQVLQIPIDFNADKPPDGFEIPPATLALRDASGAAPLHIYGPADQLTLTDTIPSMVSLGRAVQLDAAQVNALWDAIDVDQAADVFAGFEATVPFSTDNGVVSFTLPITTLPGDGPVYIAASATISQARHGPNQVNAGATLGYEDPFDVRWTDRSAPAIVEALGAAVWVDYYCDMVLDPAIDLIKVPSADTVHGGDTVTYTYMVSNPGNVPLSDVQVSDDKCSPLVQTGGDDDADDKLDPGEIWTYTCAATLTKDTTNTAIAEGIDPLGETISASASASVHVINPAIEVVKTADGEIVPGSEGNMVEWTITVYNRGDTPLYDVTVEDSNGMSFGPVTLFVADEGEGESEGEGGESSSQATWTYQTYPVASVTNIATASGVDEIGMTVTDSDQATVEGPSALEIEKLAFSLDGDDGGAAIAGGRMEYEVIVTNNGYTTQHNVVMQDLIPENTTYIEGSLWGDCDDVTYVTDEVPYVMASHAELPAGASFTVRFRVRIADDYGYGTLFNTAEAYSDEVTDPVSDSTSNTVTMPDEGRRAPQALQPASVNVVSGATVAGGTCWVPEDERSQIVVHATAYNEGDDKAENVTVTLQLPAAVVPLQADPAWMEWLSDTNQITWHIGDLAPGGYKELEIIMEVEPRSEDKDMLQQMSRAWTTGDDYPYQVIDRSDGRFIDQFSGKLVEGRFGGAFDIWVYSKSYTLYLPVLFKAHALQADLVPVALTVAPQAPETGEETTISLVLQNQGTAPASDFWVDFYVDPVTPPQVNQPWQTLCPPDRPLAECQGGTWFVDETVAPGESITLTAAQFIPDYSQWGGSFTSGGDHVLYAYVDSWNGTVPSAAVVESDESNNRFGPLTISVTGKSLLRAYPGEGQKLLWPRPLEP